MSILTTCRRCGRPLELTREQIVAGQWWLCAACKEESRRWPTTD
jgi:hypothetical protein